jgi:sialic acid synthase SpsE
VCYDTRRQRNDHITQRKETESLDKALRLLKEQLKEMDRRIRAPLNYIGCNSGDEIRRKEEEKAKAKT